MANEEKTTLERFKALPEAHQEKLLLDAHSNLCNVHNRFVALLESGNFESLSHQQIKEQLHEIDTIAFDGACKLNI